MLAGLGDLLQAVLHALLVVDVGRGDGGHADDAVHGRADVVGHVGKEVGLGLVGGLRSLAGGLQRHLLLALLLDQVVDVARADDHRQPSVRLVHEGHPRLEVGHAALRALLIGEGVVLPVLAEVLQRQFLQKLRAARIRDQLLGIALDALRPAAAVPEEVRLDGAALLVHGAVGGDAIRLRIHQQHRVELRGEALDDLALGLQLAELLDLALHLLVHVAQAQDEDGRALLVHRLDHVHLVVGEHAVHAPAVAQLVQAPFRHASEQVGERCGLLQALPVLLHDVGVDVPAEHLLVAAQGHQALDPLPCHAHAVGAVEGHPPGAGVDLEQAVVLHAQRLDDAQLLLLDSRVLALLLHDGVHVAEAQDDAAPRAAMGLDADEHRLEVVNAAVAEQHAVAVGAEIAVLKRALHRLRVHCGAQLLPILLQHVAPDVVLPGVAVGAQRHPLVLGDHLPVQLDGDGTVLFQVHQHHVRVVPRQRAGDLHLLLEQRVALLHRRQGFLHPMLVDQLLLPLRVNVLEGDDKFILRKIGLHQLALEVLNPPAAEHAIVEVICPDLLQQRVHARDGAHLLKQGRVVRKHVVFDVGLDVALVASGGELPAVAVVDGLAHAVADGRAALLVDHVHVFIGDGQRLNQIVLGLQRLLFGGDPAQRAEHGAVFAVIAPLHGEDGAANPAAGLRLELLDDDLLPAQPRVDGVEIGEAAHQRRVRPAGQRVGQFLQRNPGVAPHAQQRVQLIVGHDLLKAVLQEIDVVDGEEHVAQRADDGAVLLLRRQKRRDLPVALLRLALRGARHGLHIRDGLGGEDDVGEPALAGAVGLDEEALPPARLRPIGIEHGAAVAGGHDPVLHQALFQRGQIHEGQQRIRELRPHHAPAEVVQPLLGVAAHADVRAHVGHGEQLREAV